MSRSLLIGSAITFLFASSGMQSSAELPESDAWNSGSVFAAGITREAHGYMAEGQTAVVMARALERISPTDGQRITAGYQEGLNRVAIYSKNQGGWVAYSVTAAGCAPIDYAIKQYKRMFDTVEADQSRPANAQTLAGTARLKAISDIASSCIGSYGTGNSSVLPRPYAEKYCQCYAESLVDHLPAGEFKDVDSPTSKSAIDREGKLCYLKIREEALRGQ
jgi:hypothetical protein